LRREPYAIVAVAFVMRIPITGALRAPDDEAVDINGDCFSTEILCHESFSRDAHLRELGN